MKNTYIRAPYNGTCLDESFVGIKRAKQYIKNFDDWCNCFSDDTVSWLLEERIKMKDACSIQYVPCSSNRNSYYEKRYEKLPEIKRNFSFEEIKGEWSRTHIEDAFQYVIPDEFQSIRLKDFFYEAIYRDYPYMKEYEFDAYVPTYGAVHDIYIKMCYEYKGELVKPFLYCPLEALKTKNPQLIYDRHFGYNSEYYKGRPELGEKILSVLDSEPYQFFCVQVKGE